MAISKTEGGSGTKASLAKSLAAIDKKLTDAQAAYNRAVSNQESNTIINRAKAALDKARKAYELSKPQRNDITAKNKSVTSSIAVSKGTPTPKPTRKATSVVSIKPGVSTGSKIGDELDKKKAAEAAVTAAKGAGIPTEVIETTDSSSALAAREAIASEDLSKRTSAYDLLYNEFEQYGLGDLVSSLKSFIIAGISDSELTLRLRESEPYKTRFKANADRVKNGYKALAEADYVAIEDQYQNVMRNYGLPESYYATGKYGTQEGFQKLIAYDVDSGELEDRIMDGQNRVLKSNPEVLASLKAFYPEITNGDILAYVLDPKNGQDVINRKITAAEIGGAALQAGLNKGQTPEQIAAYAARAAELGAAGVDKAQAQQGFEAVAGGAPRGGQLASIYGENPYTQTTAETEVFGLGGKTEAATQRKKVTGLEKATFSGQSGATSTALVRDRAGAY